MADAIVDLVSTGSTLKANKLVAVEDIMPISSRLVVNQAALKVKRRRCSRLSMRSPRQWSNVNTRHQRLATVDADFTAKKWTRCSLSKVRGTTGSNAP